MNHNLYPIIDEDGKVVRAVIYATDITEQKNTETELIESKNLLDFTQKLAKIGGWQWDVQKQILNWSDETYRIHGVEPNELDYRSKDFIDFSVNCYEETHRPKILEAFQKCLDKGVSYDLELPFIKVTGDKIWIKTMGFPIFENGKIVKVIGNIIDITERRLAENALKESEMKVRAKLDALLLPEGNIGSLELEDIIDKEAIQDFMNEFYSITNIGIGIIDLKGKVLVGTGWQDVCTKFHRINPESCQNCVDSDIYLTSGIQVGQFKQYKCKNNMWDISTPIIIGDIHLGNIFLGQFFFEGEVPDYEVFKEQAKKYGFDEYEYLKAIDSVPRWSKDTVDNVMRFYSKLGMLISKLSYSNLKLAKTNEELKIAEQTLKESEIRLKEMNASKDKFFSIIAHDLKSPISGFLSLSDVLSKDIYTMSIAELTRISAAIHNSANSVYNLLNELLLWSRTQTGTIPLNIEKLNLYDLIQGTVFLLKPLAENKKINLFHSAKPKTEAFGDRNMITTVLRNLVNNAIKFTDVNGSVEIGINDNYNGDINVIQIFVKDNGIGISLEYIDKLFLIGESFLRDGTQNETGTGLGLILCREFIEKHNGKIWVESEDGYGSTFYFTLQKPS